MRKPFIVGLLAGAVLVAGALPAAAKLPPFSVEVDVSNLTAIVTLTIDQGAGYDPGVTLENLIGVIPLSDIGEDGRPISRERMLLVTVHPSFEPFVYVGTVELPSTGDYVAIPFPEVIGESAPPVEMYGGPVPFSTDSTSAPSPTLSTLAAAGAGLVAVVTAAAWLGTRRRDPVGDAVVVS